MSKISLPTYLDLLVPTLRAVDALGGKAANDDINSQVVKYSEISQTQLDIVFGPESSQTGPKIFHRIAWSRTLLKQIGQLRSVSPGVWAVTEQGFQTLELPDTNADSTMRTAVAVAQKASEPSVSQVQSWRDAAKSGDPTSMLVRDLILLWGVRRRWASASSRIESTLADNGIATDPDFTTVGLDDIVSLVSDQTHPTATKTKPVFKHVTRTVGQLPSASNGVEYVSPDASLMTAQSKMRANDYSQLGIMQNKWTLKGAVSWESIAKRLVVNSKSELSDCVIANPVVVRYDTPLLDAVSTIATAGFVFVRRTDNVISGIVTSADLSEEFASLARPFLLISEIELWLRSVLDRFFSRDELAEHVDPDDSSREVEAAHSLSLGEIERILEMPTTWERLSWAADQKVYVESLRSVRLIRNDIMHFSPDPPESKDLDQLRSFLAWTRELAVASPSLASE